MNRFICPACGSNQYTAADKAKDCIYCGNPELEKADALDPGEEAEAALRKE
jgi:predicted nucleic-acid-binding Zn-ribbon protein